MLKTILQFTIILFITTATIHARVFTRWGGNSDTIGNLTRLGGKVAYTTDVKINNGQGKLTVIGFDDTFDNITPKIHHILNISPSTPINHQPSTINISPSTSLHILQGKITTTRLILLQLPQNNRLLAIAIEQPTSEFKKSQTEPTKHQLNNITQYPGSTPTFYAETSQTKLRIAVSSSQDSIESIHNFYHSQLKSTGWQPYLSDNFGSIPQMTIYQRNTELCYILATPSKTCQSITLIHKQLTN